MSLSLYRKYRPQTFSDVVGQDHIVRTLSNSIVSGRIAHAYLFTGPRGTGKTSLARIFARAVNCQNPNGAEACLKCDVCKNIGEGRSLDIFEIDAASNTGVDNIRELRENVKFPPSQAKYKVYIIDEVHMLSTGAFNALLKTLEEPPAHVIFILATTEIHKVPETIISRCQRFDFARLSLEHIIEKLSAIAKSEGITIEKSAVEMIAIAAEGGMRDAESLFSQIIARQDKDITAKEVEEMLGTVGRQAVEAMASHLLGKKAPEALSLISELSEGGYDLDVFNKSLLNYLRQVMLVSVDKSLTKLFSHELTGEQSSLLASQAEGHLPKEVLFLIQCFTEIQGKIKSSFIPQLPLEMAIIKALSGPQAPRAANPAPTGQPIQPKAPISAPTAPVAPKMAPTAPLESKSDQTAPLKNTAPVKEISEIQEPVTKDVAMAENASFTLNDVKKHWGQFIIDTKAQNHSLSAILQSCQPAKVEGNAITIAAKFAFHIEKLAEMGNKLTLENVFAKILGSRVKINLVSAKDAGIEIRSSLTNGQSSEKAEEKLSETSSLLSDAMGIMGGSIVE